MKCCSSTEVKGLGISCRAEHRTICDEASKKLNLKCKKPTGLYEKFSYKKISSFYFYLLHFMLKCTPIFEYIMHISVFEI